jgi:hypothetical protein
MPDPSTPCAWATPEMNLQSFQRWLARKAGDLRPSSTPLDTPPHGSFRGGPASTLLDTPRPHALRIRLWPVSLLTKRGTAAYRVASGRFASKHSKD